MVFPDGDVMQPLVEQLTTQYQLRLSVQEQARLRNKLAKIDMDTTAIDKQLEEARKNHEKLKTEKSKAVVDDLVSQRKTKETERKAVEEKIKGEEARHIEYKKRIDHASTEVKHATEILKKGK